MAATRASCVSGFYEEIIDLPPDGFQRCLKRWIPSQDDIQAVGLGASHGADDSEAVSGFADVQVADQNVKPRGRGMDLLQCLTNGGSSGH